MLIRKTRNRRLFSFETCKTMYKMQEATVLLFGVLSLQVVSLQELKTGNIECVCEDNDDEKKDIFSHYWEWRLLNAPEYATFIGVYKYDHRLDEMSLNSYLRREDESKIFLKEVRTIQRHTKSPSKSSNLQLLESELVQFISGQKFKTYVWPMSNLEGPHLDFPRLLSWMKKDTNEDMMKIIKRMRLFPQQIDESITLMKEGIRLGLTMHNISIEPLPNVLKKMADEKVENSPIFKPFVKKPRAITDDEWKQLVTDAKNVIINVVQPSYLHLAKFIENEYIKHTRLLIGVSTLPNGREYYAACLKFHTTTNLTAQKIHNIGLSEVNRITKRMLKVKDDAEYKGSLKNFRKYLRTDPKFNYSNAEEIIDNYKTKGKANHKLLSKYFSVLPKSPYVIIPLSAEVAPIFPAAFYLAPPQDGSRPGTFYINTYKPETRKRYEAVILSLHEAEPGHHLQGALSIENGSPIVFRRFMEDRKYYEPPMAFPKYTAYIEGWGLYSEYLGEEMGVLSDPYDMFGRLSHEMLRACRLVVDTGMHAFGWSRDRAITFMYENTAMDMHDITQEIDRYITWPGQACGYKIGELKIKELRKKAENALGAKFDLGKFHTLIASMGGVPLDFMEKQIDKFVKEHS